MQDQGGPVRSRGRRFQDPRPYIKKNQRYKQQSTRQSRQKQKHELRSGRSSRQSPKRSTGFRQQERQDMGEKSTSRWTAYAPADETPSSTDAPQKRSIVLTM
ncbi:integrase catalytic domain-containing protein, partial [Trichonephila inaurata madagascariensis]